jgi:large subunit ribosomal protein L22
VEYKVSHRFARTSARKTRYVVDLIRGHTVNEALQILNFTRRRASDMLKKLINSAVANATYEAQRKRLDIDTDSLRIVKAFVDGGPTMKRFRPRARGRSAPIRKRTSHIVLILSQEAAASNSQ